MSKLSTIDVPRRSCNSLQKGLLIAGTIVLTFLSIAVFADNGISLQDEFNEQNSLNHSPK